MLSEKKSWNFSDYEQAFKKGYDHLLKGDSYQFDLTGRFLFSISKDTAPMDLAHALWNGMPGPAPYAHMSVLGETGICLLSNSPECLFQIRGHGNGTWIETMPIKGTLKCSGTSGDIARAWKELTNSEKNEAELFMITDLMRNDLYKITRETVQVVKKKARLLVPGLIHQSSLLCSPLKTNVSLLHLLNAIFPGGSVVGAPKIRTMEILHEIEDSPRGFYCGSTLILHRSLRRASINIRTAEINLITRLLTYGAGGGITLLSDVHEEYEETLGKRDSFIKLLGRAISQK
jgi:anthranilate/para-aminobenzoate synthase component I